MSTTILSRVFWTDFKDIEYNDKNGKAVKIGSSSAKLVMLALADVADDFGENSYQSFETLASKASIERRSVMRVVRGLIAHQFIRVAGVSRYGTNDYNINLGKLGTPPATRAKNGRPKTGDVESLAFEETGDSSAKTGDSSAETGDSTSPDSSLIHPLTNNRKVSERTRKAVLASPSWAIAAGKDYQPDPEQLALETIRQTFERIMRVNAPWERWGTFDKWLLQQEREGRPVETFCTWFVSEKFRRESVGMWLPDGKGKTGQWSFKMVYPQAFPLPAETFAARYAEIPDRHFVPPPADARERLRARLGAQDAA